MASDNFGDPPNHPYANQPAPAGKGGSITKLVLLIVGLALLIPLCCCGGIGGFWWVGGSKSPAVAQGMAAIEQNPTCRQKLGTPMERGWVTGFNTQVSTGGGSATASFNVSGPDGSGKVSCEALKENGQWQLTFGRVTFDDGTTVDLLAE